MVATKVPERSTTINKECQKELTNHQTQVEKAREESIALYKNLQNEVTEHRARIESLLGVNGCRISADVPSDGDCFVTSILHQLEQTITVTQRREIISFHLLWNEPYYMPFFGDKMGQQQYRKLAEEVTEKGAWTSLINDALPVAVSNILQRKIRIFTSQKNQPCISIDPSLMPQCEDFKLTVRTEEDPVLLAYLVIPKKEHYMPMSRIDWRTALQGKFSTVSVTVKCIKEQ